MKRATCCCSLDGNKDADNFNSECKYSMPNAGTSSLLSDISSIPVVFKALGRDVNKFCLNMEEHG